MLRNIYILFNKQLLKLGYLKFSAALLFLLNASVVNALTSVTISNEAFGDNNTGRTASATLDDAWVASFTNGVIRPDLFSATGSYSGSNSFNDIYSNAYQVDWQVGYVPGAGPGTPTSTSFVDVNSGGTITNNQSNRIQGDAPSPFTLDYRLSTGYSAIAGLNGITLDFNNSTTDIKEMGIYVGDLESRLNNGTVGRVIVFDTLGTVVANEPIIYTGTVLNGTNYTSVEPLGSASGPNNNALGAWGNNTTAFITVKSDQAIGKVIIHTGDDDHTTNNTGTAEQLGLVGFQIPNPEQVDLMIEKTVNDPAPNIGQEVTYTLLVTNKGPDIASNVVVTDIIPPGLIYTPSSMTGVGIYNEDNPTTTGLTWSISSLTINANTTLSYKATVKSP